MDERRAAPTRLVFVNGFLGAGKTSTIALLARLLAARGLSSAVVTNDQAPALVDTETIRLSGFPVAEVTAGCFCCRFSDLVVVLDGLLARNPDVILCEAVGSCTDVVATVIRPLQRFYGDAIEIAPFLVLIDASAYQEPIEDLRYLRDQQIAEADVVLLNKIDLVAERRHLRDLQPVIPVSALRGDGFEKVLELILGAGDAGVHPLRDLDYDTYARAEGLLAWLNATATTSDSVDLGELVANVASVAVSGEALHIKAVAGKARAQLTRAGEVPCVLRDERATGTITINARVRCDASALRETFERVAREHSLDVVTVDAFHPPYPRPEHRP